MEFKILRGFITSLYETPNKLYLDISVKGGGNFKLSIDDAKETDVPETHELVSLVGVVSGFIWGSGADAKQMLKLEKWQFAAPVAQK